MPRDRRNPYLILGLDYGADLGQAQTAFAKLSRRLRRNPDGEFGLDDATWALHEIEQLDDDPRARLGTYRVPADPGAYDYPEPEGALTLRPEPLPARTGPEEVEAERDRLRAEAAADYLTDRLAAVADRILGPPR